MTPSLTSCCAWAALPSQRAAQAASHLNRKNADVMGTLLSEASAGNQQRHCVGRMWLRSNKYYSDYFIDFFDADTRRLLPRGGRKGVSVSAMKASAERTISSTACEPASD